MRGRRHALSSRTWVPLPLGFLQQQRQEGLGGLRDKDPAGPASVQAAPLRSAPPASSPASYANIAARRERAADPRAGLRRLVLSRPPSPPTYCPQELRRRSRARRGEEMGEQSGPGSARERAARRLGWPRCSWLPTRTGSPQGAGEGIRAQRDPAPSGRSAGWGLLWGRGRRGRGFSCGVGSCGGLGSGEDGLGVGGALV